MIETTERRKTTALQWKADLSPMRIWSLCGACVLSCSVLSDSLRPHGQQPTRLLRPWDSPGKNAGVGGHALRQGIFPTTEGVSSAAPASQADWANGEAPNVVFKVCFTQIWNHLPLSSSLVFRMNIPSCIPSMRNKFAGKDGMLFLTLPCPSLWPLFLTVSPLMCWLFPRDSSSDCIIFLTPFKWLCPFTGRESSSCSLSLQQFQNL